MKKIPNQKAEDSKAESFIQNLRHVALTKTEAQEMRERLLAYSDLHAVPQSFSTDTSLSEIRVSAFKRFFFSYPRVLIAGTLIMLILISGTGVSYAAEGTLPGQILYPIKVAVIEPIQGALITSTAGQAEWQSELADRRLSEASTLAAQNKLATSTQTYLEAATAQHVALAQEDASALANSGNEAAALQVNSDLEAHLSAHADFFALIAPRLAASGDATSTSAVIALLQGVEKYRTQVELAREATEALLASTTDNSIAINDLGTTSPDEVGARASSTPLMRRRIALSTASTTLWIEASTTESTSSPFRELLAKQRVMHEASTSRAASSSSEVISVPSNQSSGEEDQKQQNSPSILHFLGL